MPELRLQLDESAYREGTRNCSGCVSEANIPAISSDRGQVVARSSLGQQGHDRHLERLACFKHFT